VYAGSLVFTISLVFDSLLISSRLDLAQLAIYSVAQNIAAMIQVPQRAIIASSIAHLSQAWKDKNMALIQRIYQRSSINQLLFACGLLSLVVLCFLDAVTTFQLKDTYLNGFYVVVFLGLAKLVDMGTGVNAQIIATSTYWRFEMLSGVVLISLMLPLSYFFTIRYGIIGTAIAQLISITIYNIIRIVFLWRKFRLFPFTMNSLYTVLLAAACFAACYFGLRQIHGWAGLFIRSVAFLLLYGAGVITLRLSPDIHAVMIAVKNRLGFRRS
jgi:O-antigen/teichoic acid export membrane protein